MLLLLGRDKTMKSYELELLPIPLKRSLELMTILVEAKRLQTKFSTIIQYHELENEILLFPFIRQESFKSCQLAGNQIKQSDIYFIQHEDDDAIELNNYIRILADVYDYVSETITLNDISKINKTLLNSKRGSRRTPGAIREEIMWIGPRGSSIERAEYVPVPPSQIQLGMNNLLKNFETLFCIDDLVDIAISHAQFENIHPYRDGNGRVGRILVPIQGLLRGQNYLFLSESIKINEYAYFNHLKEARSGKWDKWVRFFLEIMTHQYKKNIARLDEVVSLYKIDKEKFKTILPKNADDVYKYLMKNISTTIHEMSECLQIDYQTIRNYLNRLVQHRILSKHKTKNGQYTYVYMNMYQIHVPVDWV